jgi:hypothetical protein
MGKKGKGKVKAETKEAKAAPVRHLINIIQFLGEMRREKIYVFPTEALRDEAFANMTNGELEDNLMVLRGTEKNGKQLWMPPSNMPCPCCADGGEHYTGPPVQTSETSNSSAAISNDLE